MKFYIFVDYLTNIPNQDFFISQDGSITPPPPVSFPADVQIALVLQDGAETPSQQQRLAMWSLATRCQNEFIYAFMPDAWPDEKSHGGVYRRAVP